MQKHPELPEAFAKLGMEVRFLKALAKMGFVDPSEIQIEMIPLALDGKDILGQARTGTGKTAAFGLPILQQLDPAGRLQAICLAPTRELAVQVTAELRRLAEFADLHIVAVYGGQKVSTQLHLLGKKTHFVVGTPGRVIDFINRRVLDVHGLKFVVLDEVDRMLDIGFRDDINRVLGQVRVEHQTIFVSATIEGEIKRLSKQYMNGAVEVNVSRDRLTVEEVDQSYVTAESRDKFRLLTLVLREEKPPVCIVFCNTKAAARKLAKKLHDSGFNAAEIHGDLMQRKRDSVMEQFRRHKIQVLVATDLAARGIDVSSISHIFNYDVPPDPEVYVHRIGRTARMGARGVAISFVTREEGKQLTNVEILINRQIEERKVAGFTPSPPPQESRPASKPTPNRNVAPLIVATDDSPARKLPRKTLGGRFRPARRRRL